MAFDHLLDNQTWHALTGPHAHLASGTALAKRYPPQVSTRVAVAENSDAAFADLAQIVADGESVSITNPPDSLPGWNYTFAVTIDQMICQVDVPEPVHMDDIVTLTAADVPEMLGLVGITRPGPFLPRSIELGRFVGIRRDGTLVAMAGERSRVPGYTEISTVCTHPDWQGKGFARRLCTLLVQENWKQGIVPYLHTFPANALALRLYESLHFVKRADVKVVYMSRA